MGLLDSLKRSDVNRGVNEFKKTPGAVLVDVRDPKDFKEGHIPGSINIPESEISGVETVIPDKNTPVFVYCLSGAKSWNAVKVMTSIGYTKVKNIGGINRYKGLKET